MMFLIILTYILDIPENGEGCWAVSAFLGPNSLPYTIQSLPLVVGRKNFFSLFRRERPLHITVILLKLHLYSSLESTDVILERISEMLSIGQIFISGETVSEPTPEKCCRCPDLIKHQMIKINSLKSGQIL